MPKTLSSGLLASMQANVVTLATLVEIRRDDGAIYRITNHDQSITHDGDVYDHTIPFTLGAIQHGSQLAVDSVELNLYLDGTSFLKADFVSGRYTQAEVVVSLIDFATPANGAVVVHKGWIGVIDLNEHNTAKCEVYGLLKLLDFTVGRFFTPSCDADLGDGRCRVAIDFTQARDPLKPYAVGDWVYNYDPSNMVSISLTNAGFETDGVTTEGAAITGWTAQAGDDWHGATSDFSVSAYSGTYSVYGGTSATPTGRLEQYLYQDVDLVAGGVSASDIDDGLISFLFNAVAVQGSGAYVRTLVEIFDANGKLIDSLDTRYKPLDTGSEWRTLSLAGPLLAGARSLRLWLYGMRQSGSETQVGFDSVSLYWWDHTLGTPYEDRIHKCVRVNTQSVVNTFYPSNSGFEIDGLLANSDTQNITGWTKGTGSYWQVTTNTGGAFYTDGSRLLVGGDDSSGTQQTYTIEQTITLATAYGLDTARIDLEKYFIQPILDVMWGDTASAPKVELTFVDGTNADISTEILLDFATRPSATTEQHTAGYGIPATTRKIRLTLSARSPVGASAANVGFDFIRFIIMDVERPSDTDASTGKGTTSVTAFGTTIGSRTWDNELIWKSAVAHTAVDVVDAVTSRKKFTGTAIVGVAGTYETARIRWISGNNKGERNIIRQFDPVLKTITLYFSTTNDIQSGDAFVFERACQKRFTEDCTLLFDNAINFQGFPHLPGRLSS